MATPCHTPTIAGDLESFYSIDENIKETRAKLQPGMSSPGVKQYGDQWMVQPKDRFQHWPQKIWIHILKVT